MRDITILGHAALLIIGGACVFIGLGFYCWLTGSDNPLDEDPDWDRAIDHTGWVDCHDGRVPQAAPGSREPSQQVVSALTGFDPIARGEG